jgi:hypothetical protein
MSLSQKITQDEQVESSLMVMGNTQIGEEPCYALQEERSCKRQIFRLIASLSKNERKCLLRIAESPAGFGIISS